MTGKAKLIVGLAILALPVVVGWQVGSSELADAQLKEDLRDIAAQNPYRIGLTPPNSDEDLRSAVIRKAKEHDIELEPQQVTVERTVQQMGTEEAHGVNLAVDYTVPVKLPGYSFILHFTPSAQGKPIVPVGHP